MSLPSSKEAALADDFNRRQGFSPDEIKTIQDTVGAAPDGKWGPKTVDAVAVWQAANGLKGDGKVGPATWAAIQTAGDLAPSPPAADVEVGCGLAAYDQEWPGRPAAEAMFDAFDAAVKEGAREIRYWSSEWLVSDMGNKGNPYSGPFLERLAVPSHVRVGAWIDDPTKAVIKTTFAARMISMHITTAALMINRSNTRKSDAPWVLRYDDDDLKKISDNFDSMGIERVLTTWPRPSKSQIDQMMDDMPRLLDITGASAFEVDTEGNWKTDHLQGFRNMSEASDYLAQAMRSAAGDGRRCELTTYTYHPENSSKARLAPLMDRLLPQAYSVRTRGTQKIDYDDVLGPGKHQRLAISRARQAAIAK